jgi:hypothetical protein
MTTARLQSGNTRGNDTKTAAAKENSQLKGLSATNKHRQTHSPRKSKCEDTLQRFTLSFALELWGKWAGTNHGQKMQSMGGKAQRKGGRDDDLPSFVNIRNPGWKQRVALPGLLR